MVDEDHVDIHRQPQQNLDGQVQSGAARHRELRLLENNPNRLEQIISPSVVLEGIATAIPAGEAAANRQFANHGERHTEGDWGKPGGVAAHSTTNCRSNAFILRDPRNGLSSCRLSLRPS